MKKIIIVLCFILLLTGCNEKTKIEQENKITNSQETIIDTINEEDKIDLYSDDKKIVFKQNNNSYIVFYYEGEKITGYELYLDYEDLTTAQVAYNVIKENPDMYPNTKRVYQKGNYVVIEYNEDEYSNYTLQDIKNTYALLEQIQKDN